MIMHWRTARGDVGGANHPRGPRIDAYTTRVETHSGLLPDSRVKDREPFIHPFEFGSYCLLGGILFVSALIVALTCMFYALLVA